MTLRHRQWQVKLVSMITPRAFVEQLNSVGVEVASLGMRQGIPDPRAFVKLAMMLRKWCPQVLHSHMVHANFLARLVRLVTPVPVVISTTHSIDEGSRLREYVYRITDPLADITTNVCQAGVARYRQVKMAPHDNIRFIPNGLDTQSVRPDKHIRHTLRDQLGVRDAFVWLAVGRIEEPKDYPNMLRAFARIQDKQDTILFIAGQGSRQGMARALVQELGIEEYVRFLGVRKDIQELMNVADAFVMSSSREGLPMVLLEAAAMSLPVVTTDVGGNCEVVLDGTSGYVVAPGNPEALARAMDSMMALPHSERMQMGKVGHQHVAKNYRLEKVVDMWENLYWEFLSNKGYAFDGGQ